MPRKRKNEKITGQFFAWIATVRDGVYQADGRSNRINVGRHSLGTKDCDEAMDALKRLDLVKAVEFGLADACVIQEDPSESLSIDAVRDRYLEYAGRPESLGGASKATQKRYRAVLDKFGDYCRTTGIASWSRVTQAVAEAYICHLDKSGYAQRTQRLEMSTIVQVKKWLVEQKELPNDCLIRLGVSRVLGSPTYCYSREEVTAIVDHCRRTKGLKWLGDVCLALAFTGVRISELASLCRRDIDFDANIIRITNDPDTRQFPGVARRRTKNRRDRSFPIHPELRPVLEGMRRHPDGYVFHGPMGGRLKPDTLRNVLVKKVLPAVGASLRNRGIETQVELGRLHSFRHHFCSECAAQGVPEQAVMDWLGHQDSRVAQLYFHLHNKQAQEYMKRLTLVDSPSAA